MSGEDVAPEQIDWSDFAARQSAVAHAGMMTARARLATREALIDVRELTPADQGGQS